MTENLATRDEMKQQAIKQMKLAGIFEETIKQFEKDDLISFTEHVGNFWINEKLKLLVSAIEKKHNILIYYVIKSKASDGYSNINLIDFLYVTKYRNDWESIEADIEQGYIPTYCFNETFVDYSELGTIGFKQFFGGLNRKF